jgi:hypothetical protein
MNPNSPFPKGKGAGVRCYCEDHQKPALLITR